MVIAVVSLGGLVVGYDVAMIGSLLVLAKGPLNLTGADIPSARRRRDTVNRIIRGAGNRVPPLTVAALGDNPRTAPVQLPPIGPCFAGVSCAGPRSAF
jgi:hypothetical protein